MKNFFVAVNSKIWDAITSMVAAGIVWAISWFAWISFWNYKNKREVKKTDTKYYKIWK